MTIGRQKRSERVWINLSYQELRDLEAIRAGSGIDSLSKFIRSLLLEIIRDDKAAESRPDQREVGA